MSSALSGQDGVQRQAFSEFVKYSVKESTLILRPLWQPGEKESFLAATHLALKNEIPFDHSYSLATKTELYCSELVSYLLDSIGFLQSPEELSLTREGWILFESFYKSPRFQIVIDHQNRSKK